MAGTVKAFSVTLEQLDAAEKQFDTIATDYETHYTNMYKLLSDLDAKWSGEDNTEFVKQLESHRPTLENMVKLLRSFQAHIKAARNTYDQTENDNKALASKLPSLG